MVRQAKQYGAAGANEWLISNHILTSHGTSGGNDKRGAAGSVNV
jgi:hypothetical protein